MGVIRVTAPGRSEDTVPWAALAADPATPASLTALATVEPGTLTGAQLVDAVICSEKAASLILGRQAQLMAALAVPFVAGDPMRLAGKLARRSGLTGGDDFQSNIEVMVPEAAVSLAAGEIAAALRIAPVTAAHRVREAVHLTEEFTPARQALEAGSIDRGKLRVLLEHIQVLPTDQVGPVLDQVLPEAADRCTSEIRDITTQAVITANPEAAADRHKQAANRREVKVTPGTDAMATLKASCPPTARSRSSRSATCWPPAPPASPTTHEASAPAAPTPWSTWPTGCSPTAAST